MHSDSSSAPSYPGPRHCVIVALPDAFSLDVFGPLEVFTMAARLWKERHSWEGTSGSSVEVGSNHGTVLPQSELLYRVEVVGAEAGAVLTTSGLALPASRALSDLTDESVAKPLLGSA